MSTAKTEFSRMIDVRQCHGRALELETSPEECAALAARFDLVAVGRLTASVVLSRDGEQVKATGHLSAAIVQSCAISGEDLPVSIEEMLDLLFVPEQQIIPDSEDIELSAEDCDPIPYAGSMFDLGEALAQTMALAIDPYAEGPQAEETRQRQGLLDAERAGPFAALLDLKPDTRQP